MNPKVYFDESGNTGSNITNTEQPYFVLSAVSYTDEELQQIQKYVAYADELHFKKLKKSGEGRNVIRRLLNHSLIDEQHVTYHIVDKTFAIYAFMVDMLIEPFTLSSLLVLTDHWHKRYNSKIDVVTDNSKQLYAKRDLINQLRSIEGYQTVGYDTRKATFPPQINSMTFVDSATCYGVQIADFVASAVTFALTGVKGLEEFQKELNDSKLLKFQCYPLMPSSAKELSSEVDTSNDSDPLDFIVEKLNNPAG